jgi:two-component system response regulator NreC
VTKVVLVDDHPLFRAGIRQSLATVSEFNVVAEAGNARDAFAVIDQHQPDLVVMDVSLPGMDGVIATREVRRRSPRTRVLVLSVHDQIGDVLDALDAGASGYALKTEGIDALVTALRTVVRNERYISPTIAPRLDSYESRRTKPFDTLSILSVREREVFRLAADCLLTREIARELCISRKTVDTHLYRIHRKLGLRTSAELVRLAGNLGMIHRGQVRIGEGAEEASAAVGAVGGMGAISAIGALGAGEGTEGS